MMKLLFRISIILGFIIPCTSQASHIYQSMLEVKKAGEDTLFLIEYLYGDCNYTQDLDNYSVEITSTLGTEDAPLAKSLLMFDATPVCKSACSSCLAPGNCSSSYGILLYKRTSVIPLTKYRNSSVCKLEITAHANSSALTYTNCANNQSVYSFLEIDICKSKDIDFPTWKEISVMPMFCLNQPSRLALGMYAQSSNINISHSLKTSHLGVSYISPFTYDKPITFLGFPNPKGYNLDPESGVISFIPKRTEVSMTCIEASATRGKDVIFKASRVTSLLIIKCAKNSNPVISSSECAKNTGLLEFTSLCKNRPITFKICAKDPNAADTVSFRYNHNVPGLKIKMIDTVNGHKILQGVWNPIKIDTGQNEFSLMVTALDSKCPIPGSDFKEYKFYYHNDSSHKFKIKKTEIGNCGNYNFEIMEKSNKSFDGENIKWILNDSIALDTGKNIKLKLIKSGDYKLAAIFTECDTITIEDSIHIDQTYLTIQDFGDTTLCQNESFYFDAQSSSDHGILNSKWSFDKKLTNSSDPNKDHYVRINFPDSPSTQVYALNYSVIDSNSCTKRISSSITVLGVKEQNIQNDISLCNKMDTLILLSSHQSQAGWSGQGINETNTHLNPKFSSDSTFTISYKTVDTNGVCIVDSSQVRILPKNKILAGNDFRICSDFGDTTLIGSPAGGKWAGTGLDNSNTFYPSKMDTGKYIMRYQVADINGCTGQDSLEIEVIENIEITISQDTTVCISSDSITLEALPVGGSWSGLSVLSSQTMITLYPSDYQPGQYPYTYSLDKKSGCPSSEKVMLIIKKPAKLDFTGLADKCQNDPVFELSAYPNGGIWAGKGSILPNGNYQLDPSQLSLGVNTFSYTSQNSLCESDSTFSITLKESPLADFTISRTTMLQADTLVLTNTSQSLNAASYNWELDGPVRYTEEKEHLEVILRDMGSYQIKLTVQDIVNKCKDEKIIANGITVEKNLGFHAFNAHLVALYPNPVKDELIIENRSNSAIDIQVIGMDGKIIWSGTSHDIKRKIDLSRIPQGLYQVIISGKEIFETSRVIKL